MISKLVAIIFVGTLLAAAFGLYYATQHQFASPGESTTLTGVTCSSYSTSFTIVASESGFNDSIAHGAPKTHWPVLCVHVGELIHVTVLNVASVEPHGFAIAHYDEAGVTVLPGKSTTFTFYANTPGYFKIFCNVICAIHPFMQSGVLVVSG